MVAGGLEAMLLPDPVQPRRVERLARLDVQSAHQITHGAAHPGEALVEFDATDHDVLRLLVRAQVHGMAERALRWHGRRPVRADRPRPALPDPRDGRDRDRDRRLIATLSRLLEVRAGAAVADLFRSRRGVLSGCVVTRGTRVRRIPGPSSTSTRGGEASQRAGPEIILGAVLRWRASDRLSATMTRKARWQRPFGAPVTGGVAIGSGRQSVRLAGIRRDLPPVDPGTIAVL